MLPVVYISKRTQKMPNRNPMLGIDSWLIPPMDRAIVIIDKVSNCLAYHDIIAHAVAACLDPQLIELQLKQVPQGADGLEQYFRLKLVIRKEVYMYVLEPIEDANTLESTLLALYKMARGIILQSVEGPLAPSVSTQVIYNVPWETITNRNEVYRFDGIFGGHSVLDRLGIEDAYKYPLTSGTRLEVKNYYESNWKAGEYEVGCVGGTFDHLHDGHKILLSMGSFLAQKKFVIGVSNQGLLNKKKFHEFLEPYEVRKKTVEEFITRLRPDQFTVEIHELGDMYGPTATVEKMDFLLVTEETAKGGEMVNSKRKENGLCELKVFVVRLIEDHSKEDKISSTYIREFEHEGFEEWLKTIDPKTG